VGLVSPLQRPLFAYSGANRVFQAAVRRAPLVDVGIDNFPDRYHREASRPAPDDLFSSTSALFALAVAHAPAPPPLFAYRAPGVAPSGAAAQPVGRVHAEWSNHFTAIDYTWDAPSRLWRRTQDRRAHLDTAGRQVAPSNVIIQFVTYRNTGLVDPSGSAVPEAQVVGDGDGWVLTGGWLIPTHWSKPSAEAVTHYLDRNGTEVILGPGRTWVELVPPGRTSFTERPPDPPANPAPTPSTTPPGTDPPPSTQPEPRPAPPGPGPGSEPQPNPQRAPLPFPGPGSATSTG
jgi:hypothetical protein